MNQFINRKRKREEEEEEEENEDIFAIPNRNKKIKKIQFSFPQETSEISDFTSIDSHLDKNISFNKIDKDSNSTLFSKNEQLSYNTKKNSFLFQINKFDENQIQNQNFKKIELEFEEIDEDKNPIIKSKSLALNINIKRELLSSYSSNFSNNNSYKDSSSYYSYSNSNKDAYYPYEIGEIIENQYLVSNFIFYLNFKLFLNIGG